MQPRESAGGIIVNLEGKIALVEQHGNSWSFPKGGIEEGETLLAAAKREIFEETGVTELTYVCDLGSYERYSISLDGKGENPAYGMRKRTFFLFTTNETAFRQEPHDAEITQMRWVTVDEGLELLTHPKDKEFLESLREKIATARKV
jgi:putative (di)nucleoside polyphosphate hydrolase